MSIFRDRDIIQWEAMSGNKNTWQLFVSDDKRISMAQLLLLWILMYHIRCYQDCLIYLACICQRNDGTVGKRKMPDLTNYFNMLYSSQAKEGVAERP